MAAKIRGRRSDVEILEELLKTLKGYDMPHSINEISDKSNLDWKTTRNWYRIFEIIAKYKCLPLAVQGLPGVYKVRKLNIKPFNIS